MSIPRKICHHQTPTCEHYVTIFIKSGLFKLKRPLKTVFNGPYFCKSVLGSQMLLAPTCAQPPPFGNIPHENGTCVTTSEPTLTYPCHLKTIAYIRVHFWWYTFYGLGQMYNDIFILL